MAPGRISGRRLLGALGAGGAVALAGCAGGDGDAADGNGNETEDGTGTTTGDQPESDLTVSVLQDLSGPVGPEFGHQGLSGLLSGLATSTAGRHFHSPRTWRVSTARRSRRRSTGRVWPSRFGTRGVTPCRHRHVRWN